MALRQLRGPSAIVVMSHLEPGVLVAARLGNAGGVSVGYGDGEMFIASDMPAILEHTRRMVFLENRQMAVVTREGADFSWLDGRPLTPSIHTIPWDPISAAKGEYKHFMQKEIYEQANSLTDTIRGRVDLGSGEVYLEQVTLTAEQAQALDADGQRRLRHVLPFRAGRRSSCSSSWRACPCASTMPPSSATATP